MQTGFNTDIEANGRVYHIQTEDRGLSNPVVESLVYTGGEIITSRKTSYADLIASGAWADADILRRMEAQHRQLIQEIRHGKFETEEQKPFGHAIVTGRSFDDVVLSFLQENVSVEPIRLHLTIEGGLVEGSSATIGFTVVEQKTERPVPRAHVAVRLVAAGQASREIFSGTSDASGKVAAAVEIPQLSGARAALVCRVEADGRSAVSKRTIRKAVASAGPA